MPETSLSPRPSTLQLILVPSIITLGITILRLVGELQHWPTPWFSTTAGGGLAIIGISWLPLIFGPHFAVKLAGKGEGPASTGKSIAFPVVGLLILIAGGYVSFTGAHAQSTSRCSWVSRSWPSPAPCASLAGAHCPNPFWLTDSLPGFLLPF